MDELSRAYTRTKTKEDFYVNSGRRIGDFILGFFGIWIISYILFLLITFVSFIGIGSVYNLFIIFPIIVLILAVIGTVISFKIGRRFIGTGIIVSSLIPLLIYGACWLIIVSTFRIILPAVII